MQDNPEVKAKVEEQIREKFKLASENGEKIVEYKPIEENQEEFDGSPIVEDDFDSSRGIELEEED